MYTKLNDAAKHIPQLNTGATKIWYTKDWPAVHMMVHLKTVTKASVNETHALLGNIDCSDLDTIYRIMQGEAWSPNGEACDLLKSLGIDHTSMSVGDVIQIGDDYHLVDFIGFTLLT